MVSGLISSLFIFLSFSHFQILRDRTKLHLRLFIGLTKEGDLGRFIPIMLPPPSHLSLSETTYSPVSFLLILFYDGATPIVPNAALLCCDTSVSLILSVELRIGFAD